LVGLNLDPGFILANDYDKALMLVSNGVINSTLQGIDKWTGSRIG